MEKYKNKLKRKENKKENKKTKSILFVLNNPLKLWSYSL